MSNSFQKKKEPNLIVIIECIEMTSFASKILNFKKVQKKSFETSIHNLNDVIKLSRSEGRLFEIPH